MTHLECDSCKVEYELNLLAYFTNKFKLIGSQFIVCHNWHVSVSYKLIGVCGRIKDNQHKIKKTNITYCRLRQSMLANG